MSKEKMTKLIEALASAGYEIAKFNLRTRDQSEFDYNEIELLIIPVPPPPKKD
jgi:hypothetical protein